MTEVPQPPRPPEVNRPSDTVYSFLSPDRARQVVERQVALPPPPQVATLRAYAEAVMATGPMAAQIRRPDAIYGWPGSQAPEPVSDDARGKQAVELKVDPDQTYVASLEPVQPLFDSKGWRDLQENLLDRGNDPDTVSEILDFLADPGQKIATPQPGQVLDFWPSQLRQQIIDYWRPAVQAYEASVQTLTEYRQHPEKHTSIDEVVVPPEAVQQANLA